MENAVQSKSFAFATGIVKIAAFLQEEKREFVLSKQVLKSGTSIGANVREAQQAQSKRDFLAKISIALKEAEETVYWLELLRATDFLPAGQFSAVYRDACELKRMLTAIVKTTR